MAYISMPRARRKVRAMEMIKRDGDQDETTGKIKQ
jgi:hypothetical protein